jgi:hypothetical protein
MVLVDAGAVDGMGMMAEMGAGWSSFSIFRGHMCPLFTEGQNY